MTAHPLDSLGRIVLPKELCDMLGIELYQNQEAATEATIF